MLLERTFAQRPLPGTPIAIARPNTITGQLGCIDRSDLPYIYHHLRKGCILSVHRMSGDDRPLRLLKVSYSGLHLGNLNYAMAERVRQLEQEGRPYRLTVDSLDREKYMPPTAVNVVLDWGGD